MTDSHLIEALVESSTRGVAAALPITSANWTRLVKPEGPLFHLGFSAPTSIGQGLYHFYYSPQLISTQVKDLPGPDVAAYVGFCLEVQRLTPHYEQEEAMWQELREATPITTLDIFDTVEEIACRSAQTNTLVV